MRICNHLIISLLLLVIAACKEPKKQVAVTEDSAPFIKLKSPAQTGSALPFLFSNEDQTLLSWVEKEGDSLSILKYASLKGGKWQESKEILRGTDWFVNWADFPMIAENKGNLWSHVLKKSSVGTYSYDVKINVKQKGDSIWKTNIPLHTDASPTEHGFVTVLPYKDAFFVNWLDGRNTEENELGARGAMTLRAAKVSVTGAVIDEHELDPRTCDCCQTTAAITANGPVVLYRDRTADEFRDISIVRQVNGKWTEPKSIHNDNWKIKGCPVNGPKAAALGNTLAVAWFTAAEQHPAVKLAFSTDGGAVFDAPITIAEHIVIGRVDLALIDKHTAIVSWMESKDKKTFLKAVKVSATGLLGSPIVIARLSGSRKSGFPQMEMVDNQLYFAWTEVIEKTTRLQTGYIPLTKF